MTPDDRTLVPARRVAAIAGISPQRLWYWEKTELVTPTVRRELSARKIVRLYSLDACTEVVVAARLVDRPGISLQHLRSLIARLSRYEHPLTELVFAVQGREIFFLHPDGFWEGSREPLQGVARETLDLDEIRSSIRRALARNESTFGQIEKRRGTYGSRDVVAGTRVPVSSVQSFIEAGKPDERILAAFPSLRPEDIAAIRRSGRRTA